MATDKNNFKIKDGVTITEEVVACIAGISATDIDGVESLAGNLKRHTIAKAGMKKLSKAIRVVPEDATSLSIGVAINIAYGKEVPQVSEKIQEKVKTTVENMTGLSVTSVDVRIASVAIDS